MGVLACCEMARFPASLCALLPFKAYLRATLFIYWCSRYTLLLFVIAIPFLLPYLVFTILMPTADPTDSEDDEDDEDGKHDREAPGRKEEAGSAAPLSAILCVESAAPGSSRALLLTVQA